jgi:hypothetical protein
MSEFGGKENWSKGYLLERRYMNHTGDGRVAWDCLYLDEKINYKFTIKIIESVNTPELTVCPQWILYDLTRNTWKRM